MKPLFTLRLAASAALIALLLPVGLQPSQAVADDLDLAFSSLTNGRVYLKGFGPPLNQKTRRGLVDDFIGANGQSPNRPVLLEAVDRAIAIRAGEAPEPASFPSGQAPRSVQAQVIGWEAMESLVTGYLYAGNRDLLDGTRVSYPGGLTHPDAREMPKEESVVFPGTSQRQLTYARLYFLQGIKDVLDYVARDTTGKLRAGSSAYPTVPHYVKFDDERSEILPFPRFEDPNFGGPAVVDGEANQAVAYLFGSSLERYGLSAVAYADQLWRSAFAGPGAGLSRTATEKAQMLERAADVLKGDVHAQFLATLPIAAQLSDGTDGTLSEFQQSKIDQARVSVTDALRLREQILAGEKPTQTALVSAWDTASIQQQIARCEDAYEAARLKWGGDAQVPVDGSVAYELARAEQAQSLNADREVNLRNSLETQLYEITGIDPSDYGGIRTEAERTLYLQAVKGKFDVLIDARDPNAQELQDGSLMSVQALRLIQALREATAKRALVDSYPEKMRAELVRLGAQEATISAFGYIYTAIEASYAVALAKPNISICKCGTATGVTEHYDVKSSLAGAMAGKIKTAQRAERLLIDSINAAALIKNILIEQEVASAEFDAAIVYSAIAGAELRQLLAKANRFVSDHIFYQDISNTLWYRDPSLAFKREKAEEEYQSRMQEYRIELYKLARMVEAAWAERFINPIKQANGSTITPLNNGSYDDFTEAESVFSVANHVRGRDFFNAIKAWDIKLRDPLYRGSPSPALWDANTFTGQPISVRRDIFKLIDYRYDFNGNQYLADDNLSRQSIQRFRAILLDLASRDPANANGLTRLRIDFPLTYNQARVILGQQTPVPIVQQNRPGGTIDQFWNHRVRKLGVKIVGNNVFASGTTVPVSFELFGNVDRIGFFPDSLYTSSRTITSFQVPLYQRDPDKRLVGEPFFGTAIGIPAAIGSTPAVMNDVPGWPLFCDNLVLRIPSQGSLRIENITDIELTMQMEVGSPPAIAWP